jgi:hypothetical protein
MGMAYTVMHKRRAIGEAMMTVGGALAVVLTLVLLDQRVRDQVGLLLDPHHPAATLSRLGERASAVVAIVVMAARHQSLEHAPLVIFAVAAAVLVLFMVRT